MLNTLANRRGFFGQASLSAGSIALAALANPSGAMPLLAGPVPQSPGPKGPGPQGSVHPPLEGLPHFAPKAKSIIYLHMNG